MVVPVDLDGGREKQNNIINQLLNYIEITIKHRAFTNGTDLLLIPTTVYDCYYTTTTPNRHTRVKIILIIITHEIAAASYNSRLSQ